MKQAVRIHYRKLTKAFIRFFRKNDLAVVVIDRGIAKEQYKHALQTIGRLHRLGYSVYIIP